MNDFSPIACEVCRTKKRKVGRGQLCSIHHCSDHSFLCLCSSVIVRCELAPKKEAVIGEAN
jgi:hypothetical protein